MNNQQELSLLKQFEIDSGWFHSNINKLREMGFTGKFVAIKGSKPIAFNERIEEVTKSLIEKSEDPSFIFIEFVHPEGYTLIL